MGGGADSIENYLSKMEGLGPPSLQVGNPIPMLLRPITLNRNLLILLFIFLILMSINHQNSTDYILIDFIFYTNISQRECLYLSFANHHCKSAIIWLKMSHLIKIKRSLTNSAWLSDVQWVMTVLTE